MEPVNINAASADMMPAASMAQTEPLHQYAPTPQYLPAAYPAKVSAVTSEVLAVGVLGLIIVGAGTMGTNLHRVNDGTMSMGDALGNSLVKGAVGGVAAGSATAASSTLTSGGMAGLAVTLAAATGVSYLLSK